MRNACKVLAGTVNPDPYTGAPIRFVVGGPSEIDVDHVVALSDAWQKGASTWPASKRLALANDPLNLLAVSAGANRSKGDGDTATWPASKRLALANDPLNLLAVSAGANRSKGDGDTATWLPANKPYRCTYVARQVAVKRKYALSVTTAERAAMVAVLSTCATTTVPAAGSAPTSAQPPRTSTPATSTPKPAPRESSPPPASKPQPFAPPPAEVFYTNCAAARAAGAAPIRAGEPGYSRKLDRDGDGVACEN